MPLGKEPYRIEHISISDILNAISGHILWGDHTQDIRGISIDSRTIKEGEIFFAIEGERYDGHDFITDAINRGARGIVVERAKRGYIEKIHDKGISIILVDNTIYALGELARWWRGQNSATVIAITGSVGKTTTKEMLYSIVSRQSPTLKNRGNQNNLIGVPLTLFRMDSSHQVVILEMGTNSPGEIGRLREIADPDIALITMIGSAHLEGLKDVEGVLKEKLSLFAETRKETIKIINGDCGILKSACKGLGISALTYGLGEENSFQAREIEDKGMNGISFKVCFRDICLPITLNISGLHNVYNALAAISVSILLGIPSDEISKALFHFKGIDGRFRIIRCDHNITLIDDTYNSNPTSLKAAIQNLLGWKIDGKGLIVVIGDMLELGAESPRFHLEAGKEIAPLRPRLFITIGRYAKELVRGACEEGLPVENTVVLNRVEDIVSVISEKIREGDIIFLKASRKIGLDRVIDALLEGVS